MRWLPLILLVGCGPDDPGTSSTDPGGPLGDNAELLGIEVSTGDLSPAWDPARTHYAVDAANEATLEATPADPAASIRWFAEDHSADVFDEQTGPKARFDLTGGTRITVEVTSEDGSATTRTRVVPVPYDFPELTVFSDDPSPGYFFTANIDFGAPLSGVGRYRFVLDNEGIPLWIQKQDGLTFDFRSGPDGALTWLTVEQGGIALAADGTETRHLPVTEGTDPHEFTLLPDGGALIIGTRTHPTDLTAEGGPVDFPVIEQVAQELAPDGSVRFEWSTRGQVDLAHVPAMVFSDWTAEAIELAHMNSIEVDPHDGNWVISLRLPSQVVKVDRSTGDVLWRLGGPGSEFSFVDDDRANGWQGFAWQHSARVTGPDRILVFDNAMTVDAGAPSGDSRYAEYQLDLSAMTATLVAEWELADSGWTDAAGSAQRMANGNTVIGFGNNLFLPDFERAPQIVEVDPAGDIRFSLTFPQSEWAYRAWKLEDFDPERP